MSKWTKKELDNISNLDYIICTLNDRKNKLTFYSYESARIRAAIAEINKLREQKYSIINLDENLTDYEQIQQYSLEEVIDFANEIREKYTENFNVIKYITEARDMLESCSYLLLPIN